MTKQGKTLQVWLNIQTGEFSNSWQPLESTRHLSTDWHLNNQKEHDKQNVWKLIEYQCLSDENFEFNRLMKLR